MVKENMEFLKALDPEIGEAVEKEFARQSRNIELIASENIVSEAVLAAAGTVLTNKYAEGYPSKRYYGGCECVDIAEEVARKRACELFGAEHANVQPHSGANANFAVYTAFCKPGDTVMGMNLAHGGHLTHGSPVNVSGMYFNIVPYGVNDDGFIDYDEMERLAHEHKPKMIIAGASAYPRIIDFERFAKVAKDVGAIFMVDMAHIAGLVAAGLHPSPVPYADVVTTTTHKTLRGPRGGMILCKEWNMQSRSTRPFSRVRRAVRSCTIIAAKAVCFGEALKPEFKEYARQVVANSKAFADALLKEGFKLVSGGTDNHLCLVDLRPFAVTGKEFEKRLDSVYITVNKNAIPNDPEKPFVTSGIRVGTPAATSRGFKEADFVKVAELMRLAATDIEGKADEIRAEVCKLCDAHPIYR